MEETNSYFSLWIGVIIGVCLAIFLFIMPIKSLCPALSLKYQDENLGETPREIFCLDGNSCKCTFTFANGSKIYQELQKPSFDTEEAGLITFVRYIKEKFSK
jgi:MFS superfamily sulfate permease-like transporter